MKTQLIIGATCLLLGAAAVWLLNPGAPSSQSQTEAAPSKSARPSASSSSPINDGPSDLPESKASRINSGGPGMDSEHADLLVRDSHDNMRSNMATRQAKEFAAKIATLADKLSLDATQEAALRKFYAAKNQAIEAQISSTGARDGKSIAQVSALMNHDGLEETLNDILTDEQKETYEELKAQAPENP